MNKNFNLFLDVPIKWIYLKVFWGGFEKKNYASGEEASYFYFHASARNGRWKACGI